MRRRGLLVLVVAVAAAGCGGGGNARLSHSEFVSKANAICRDSSARVSALPQPTTAKGIRSYLRRTLAIQRDGLARLRKLNPPKSDEEGYNRLVGTVEQGADLLQTDLLPALKAKDTAAAQRATRRLRALAGTVTSISAKLGLTGCAQPTP